MYIAKCHEKLLHQFSIIENSYLECYQKFPYRAEPLYYLAHDWYYKLEKPKTAFGYIMYAMTKRYPNDAILFVDDDIYE